MELTLKKVKKLLFTQKVSIIFNMKYNKKNTHLYSNFIFTLKWFMKHYPPKEYEYILIEQDTEEKINIPKEYPIKKIFIYNDGIFNRGWGYNVAVKNFIKKDVVVFCDSDIILQKPENLIESIEICKKEKKIVSPYSYVTFTSKEERNKIFDGDYDIRYISDHPVTIAGGIVTVNKEAFLEVGGFEEYRIYGGEDRSLDVLFMYENNFDIIEGYGIHLYHPENPTKKTKESNYMLQHLKKHYSCYYDKQLKPYDFIHKFCEHKTADALEEHVKLKRKYFGDLNLYKNKNEKEINSFPK